jgi:hypothetical protein
MMFPAIAAWVMRSRREAMEPSPMEEDWTSKETETLLTRGSKEEETNS